MIRSRKRTGAVLVLALALTAALMLAAGLTALRLVGLATPPRRPASIESPTTAGPPPRFAPTSFLRGRPPPRRPRPPSWTSSPWWRPPAPWPSRWPTSRVNNKLADVADKTEVVIWENAEQLKAYVAGNQGDFVTMPSNNSAIFYNKGLKLQLLDISVWNITYLITTDPMAGSFADIKGQSLVVPFQGSVPGPDVPVHRQGARARSAEGLRAPLRHRPHPGRAAAAVRPGRERRAQRGARDRRHAADQGRPRSRCTGLSPSTRPGRTRPEAPTAPSPGTVATASVLDKPEVIAAFEREYKAAVQWMLDNPEEAGKLVETQLPQLGLKAAVMTASLKSITWKYTPAADARASLEAFYQNLSELVARCDRGQAARRWLLLQLHPLERQGRAPGAPACSTLSREWLPSSSGGSCSRCSSTRLSWPRPPIPSALWPIWPGAAPSGYSS